MTPKLSIPGWKKCGMNIQKGSLSCGIPKDSYWAVTVSVWLFVAFVETKRIPHVPIVLGDTPQKLGSKSIWVSMKEVCWNYSKEIWFQWASTSGWDLLRILILPSVARKTYAQNPDIVKSSVVQNFLGWPRNCRCWPFFSVKNCSRPMPFFLGGPIQE